MKGTHFQIFLGMLFILFIIYILLKFTTTVEGLETLTPISSGEGGVAGNADSYASTIKSNTIKQQDTFLISKYRKSYETVILNLDDLINNLMLQTTLNIDSNGKIEKVLESFKTLNTLSESKKALNQVMQFVDSQK
jgi:hypothetical protein